MNKPGAFAGHYPVTVLARRALRCLRGTPSLRVEPDAAYGSLSSSRPPDECRGATQRNLRNDDVKFGGFVFAFGVVEDNLEFTDSTRAGWSGVFVRQKAEWCIF